MFTSEELVLAARNRTLPLEALRYDVTPTGLHFLLAHYDIPQIEADDWTLRVGGLVEQPLELSLSEVREMPAVTHTVTMECAGHGRVFLSPRPLNHQPWLHGAIGTAEWTGTPLASVLERAGLRPEAVEIVFTGDDRGEAEGLGHDFARSLSVADARAEEVILAWAMNGRPLEPQHGFPLRLVVPGWYGMASVKWLRSIAAIDRPFDGYMQVGTYLYKQDDDDPGEPVRQMRVNSLMIPPGTTDFYSRRRKLEAAPVTLRGRAWAGARDVVRVEVGIDGVWHEAELEASLGRFAWRGWSFVWDASPGEHQLACRATDTGGEIQPEHTWNLEGMGNNAVYALTVHVG